VVSVSFGIGALVVSAMSTGAVGQVGGVPQAAASQPVTIAVIGDYGGDNGGEYRLADLVARLQPDAVATVGDNLYPTPSTVTGTDKYDLVVGKFFCQFLAGVPAGPYCNGRQSAVNRFFPATGNHDYSDGPIANYLAYFSLPGRGVTSEFPTGSDQYYDVVLGPRVPFPTLPPLPSRRPGCSARWRMPPRRGSSCCSITPPTRVGRRTGRRLPCSGHSVSGVPTWC
jgi:hypothetical protein